MDTWREGVDNGFVIVAIGVNAGVSQIVSGHARHGMAGLKGKACVLLAAAVLSTALLPQRTAAQSTGIISACERANSATNALLHFYLAIDTRQFAAAYQCFSTWEQGQMPLQKFKAGYAHEIAAHVVYADDGVSNGTPATQVNLEVHTFNRVAGKITLVSYQGAWHVNPGHQLTWPHLFQNARTPEPSVTPTRPNAVFASHHLQVVRRLSFDVTGGRIPDAIYFTTRQHCTNCHAQQLWIYSQDRLVYQQEVDDGQFIPWRNHLAMQVRTDTPGSRGIDTCCPTERTYVTWYWTEYGFVFQSRRDVKF